MPKGPERGLLHLRQGEIVAEPCSLYKAASPEPRCVRFAAGIPHSHMAGLDLKERLIFLVGSIPPLATTYKKAPFQGVFLYVRPAAENHVRWTRIGVGRFSPCGRLRRLNSLRELIRPWPPNAKRPRKGPFTFEAGRYAFECYPPCRSKQGGPFE